MDEKLIEAVRCFPCLWQTMSKAYKDLRARESATTSKSLKSSSTSIVTLFLTAPQPRYEHVEIRGVVGRTSRSLPLKTNIVNTDAARGEGYCSCPVCLCVCVCVSVRSFLPPRASRPRNIGTYVFTATRKKLL